jgi:hypothetical protein
MAEIQIQIVNSYRHGEKVGKYPHGVVFTESEIAEKAKASSDAHIPKKAWEHGLPRYF